MLNKSELAVLSALIRCRQATRGELIACVGLSRPTVDRALRSLEDRGLVQALGPISSNGGRPPVAYVPRWEELLIAAADLELPRVNFVLADLAGKVIARGGLSLEGYELQPAATLELLSLRLQEWVGTSWEKVLAVGIAIPGPVMKGEVSLVGATLPTWIRVPAQNMLERALRVPVRVYHDLHLLALAEARLGGWNDEIILFLALRPGLVGEVRFGASILLGGQPYWGAHGNGGALLRAFVPPEELTGSGRLDRLAAALAERAVHAIALLDPDRVVVDAALLGPEASRFLRYFREHSESRLRGEYPGALRVSLAKGGEFGGALGAALAVQDELLRSPELFLRKGGDRRGKLGAYSVPRDSQKGA